MNPPDPVITLGPDDDNRTVRVPPGATVEVVLPESSGGGYLWSWQLSDGVRLLAADRLSSPPVSAGSAVGTAGVATPGVAAPAGSVAAAADAGTAGAPAGDDPPAVPAPGAGYWRRLRLRVEQPGRHRVRGELGRSWEARPEREFTVELVSE